MLFGIGSIGVVNLLVLADWFGERRWPLGVVALPALALFVATLSLSSTQTTNWEDEVLLIVTATEAETLEFARVHLGKGLAVLAVLCALAPSGEQLDTAA